MGKVFENPWVVSILILVGTPAAAAVLIALILGIAIVIIAGVPFYLFFQFLRSLRLGRTQAKPHQNIDRVEGMLKSMV